MKASVKKWRKERDKMLLKCDTNELRKFINAHADMYGEKLVRTINEADAEVLTIALHKMRVAAVKLPERERKKSAVWLISRGFTLWD